MNLLLVEHNELLLQSAHSLQQATVQLCDQRAEHIISVIKAKVGDQLKIGIVDGDIGTATISAIGEPSARDRSSVTLIIDTLDKPPPPKLPLHLVVALPRPKSVNRIIRYCTECGVQSLHFINSYRVEKSYWTSPKLSADNLAQQVRLGLTQCIDTKPMKIHLHKRFKPFVEDQLPALIGRGRARLLHPYAEQPFHPTREQSNSEQWLIIGPEGGFIDYEVNKLRSTGATVDNIGQRIYRTETIVAMMLGHFTLKA